MESKADPFYIAKLRRAASEAIAGGAMMREIAASNSRLTEDLALAERVLRRAWMTARRELLQARRSWSRAA
jgi:hypothetical protein